MIPVQYVVKSIFNLALAEAKAEVAKFRSINPEILAYIRENGLANLEAELEKIPGWVDSVIATPTPTAIAATAPIEVQEDPQTLKADITAYLEKNGPTFRPTLRDAVLQGRSESSFNRAIRRLVEARKVIQNPKGFICLVDEAKAKIPSKKDARVRSRVAPNRLGARGVQPFTRHRKMQEALQANGGALAIEALAKATGFDRVCYNFTISLKSALERGWFTLGDDGVVRDAGKEIPQYDAKNLSKGRPFKPAGTAAPSKCETTTTSKSFIVINDAPAPKDVRVLDPAAFGFFSS